jgi:hypothetical protein
MVVKYNSAAVKCLWLAVVNVLQQQLLVLVLVLLVMKMIFGECNSSLPLIRAICWSAILAEARFVESGLKSQWI